MNFRNKKRTINLYLLSSLVAVIFLFTSCDDNDDVVLEPTEVAYVSIYHGSPNTTGLDIDVGNGPINAARAVITDMDGWEQIVRVMSVDSFDITTAMDDAETDMVRVEVLVRYQGPNDDQPMDMTTITWIAPN